MKLLQTTTLSPSLPFLKSEELGQTVLAQQPNSVAMTRFVCAIANNTWRLCKKITGNENEQKLKRHVNALQDALSDIGVLVKDHDGEPYDVGMAVKVVAWEKRANATREEIVETIKPTIRWNDKLLQWGEVVACAPSAESDAGAKKGE